MQLDQKINVVILILTTPKRIGLKQLTPHPWDAVGDDITVGTVVKVAMLLPITCFVEVQPGVEGLIHVTEISLVRICVVHKTSLR